MLTFALSVGLGLQQFQLHRVIIIRQVIIRIKIS